MFMYFLIYVIFVSFLAITADLRLPKFILIEQPLFHLDLSIQHFF